MQVFTIIISICSIIGTVYTVLKFYQTILSVVGLFKKQKYKNAETKHNFGICIAARNEEKVIKNMLDSIYAQDYPMDKITIYICANNCTDKTAEIVKNYIEENKVTNLKLYERENKDERTKGFALRYLFDQIKKDYGIETHEGYFIFDADNVLKGNYLTKMNDAYDAGGGIKIVTSCRYSKNMHQNWISFSYAIHWLKTCLSENRAKYLFGLSCRIQGTGFVFPNALVKDGWKYTSLTEDRAFCTDAVINGYHISYCEEAMFYDEQPYKLKVALRQRLRWSKGHLQSSVENEPKLIKNMLKFNKDFPMTYDCFWLNFPSTIESMGRKILRYICRFCLIIFFGQTFSAVFGNEVLGYLLSTVLNYLESWLGNCATAVITLLVYRKNIEKTSILKMIFNILMFPFFYVIGRWTAYIALFKKVDWKPIPHDTVVDIEKLNKA